MIAELFEDGGDDLFNEFVDLFAGPPDKVEWVYFAIQIDFGKVFICPNSFHQIIFAVVGFDFIGASHAVYTDPFVKILAIASSGRPA